MPNHSPRPRLRTAIALGALGLASTTAWASVPGVASAAPSSMALSSSGLQKNAIKHVWLIILENKSYDASFTGLNKNSYLWQTLPKQGVLMTNYYGTSQIGRAHV